MLYINPDNEYPRHIGDIQLEHPTFKEGDNLPAGWALVVEADIPAVGENQLAYESFPEEVDGVMTQNWQVRAMTAEEIERRDAPANAKAKLIALGLTEAEALAIVGG